MISGPPIFLTSIIIMGSEGENHVVDYEPRKRIVTTSPICLPACGAIHKFQLKRSKARFRIHAETGFLLRR